MITAYQSIAAGGTVIVSLDYPPPPGQAAALLADSHPSTRAELAGWLARLDLRERGLIAAATPAQHEAVTYGDCWRLDWTDTATGQAVRVWGYVKPLRAVHEDELKACGDVNEANRVTVEIAAAHRRGWRYSRCYSVREPRGELGSPHVAQLIPVPAAAFADARRARWAA